MAATTHEQYTKLKSKGVRKEYTLIIIMYNNIVCTMYVYGMCDEPFL